jgi:hypothetical protein
MSKSFKKQMKYNTFSYTLFLSSFALLGSIVYLCIRLGFFTPSDQEEYQKLLVNIEGELERNVPSLSTQERIGVRKDLFFYKNGSRQQLKVLSDYSELQLHRIQNRVELMEEMRDIQCYMQEKLFSSHATKTPMQSVLFLEAATARYFYKTEDLIAENVKIQRFLAHGDNLNNDLHVIKPLISGIAEKIRFFYDQNGPNVKTEQFKATLNPVQGDK